MRKVFLKVLFILCFLIGFLAPIANNTFASEPASIEVTAGEEYTYEKVWVEGVLFIFVYDENGRVIDVFPDYCGGPHGGH